MRVFALSLIAASTLALSTAGSAQSVGAPKHRENARYMDVNNWKFVPNGTARAKDVWHNIYLPAIREAGVPMPTVLHPDTGEWDMVLIFPLPGGYRDLEYTNISPSDAKWYSLVEKKLGADKATALGIEMEKLIARKERYIAHEHLDEAK